ncbi:MAG: hypothetical protein ACLTR6_03770 [Clostridium fessum]
MDVRDLYLAQSALQNLIGRPGTIGVSAAVGATDRRHVWLHTIRNGF